uniref:Uncharacterized protein n=1 Tax=Helianthus annuus TaxID=4232 RepID=A0A251VCE0_HELAN
MHLTTAKLTFLVDEEGVVVRRATGVAMKTEVVVVDGGCRVGGLGYIGEGVKTKTGY